MGDGFRSSLAFFLPQIRLAFHVLLENLSAWINFLDVGLRNSTFSMILYLFLEIVTVFACIQTADSKQMKDSLLSYGPMR